MNNLPNCLLEILPFYSDKILILDLRCVNLRFYNIFSKLDYNYRFLKNRYSYLNNIDNKYEKIISGKFGENYFLDLINNLIHLEKPYLDELFWLYKEIDIKNIGILENEYELENASDYELEKHPYFTHKIRMNKAMTKQLECKKCQIEIHTQDLNNARLNFFYIYDLI